MDDFERQLQNALRRQDPSPDFEARVLAATRRSESRWTWLFAGRMRWVSAMAASVIVITGVAWEHERVEEQKAGEAAKARLELALRITSVKLNKIREKVAEHQNNE